MLLSTAMKDAAQSFAHDEQLRGWDVSRANFEDNVRSVCGTLDAIASFFPNTGSIMEEWPSDDAMELTYFLTSSGLRS